MIITGLDLSLTSTGVARIEPDGVTLHRIQPKKLTGHERMEHVIADISNWISDADVVAIEGPSYGSTTGSQHERAGLWWLIAHQLWTEKVPYVSIPPTSLKKYATGYGGGAKSGKDQVLAAVIRRYPNVPVDGNDVCDAFVLAAMAATHYGEDELLATVPQPNRAALASVQWPELSAWTGTPL